MKLIIQIPCLNERDHITATFADLPRRIDGIDTIETLVIDDGSTDDTSQVAEALGVHHIVRFPENRGLAAAYTAGLDASFRLGADIVVNTDADNQYKGADIARLVAPLVAGRADMTVGDRNTDAQPHFSFMKRLLQRWGSAAVRRASGTNVRDSTSGFRALGRKALTQLFVHNQFSYTLEQIIQAGQLGLTIVNVDIRTNPKTRESRLFRSIPQYLSRNGPVILRAYSMYHPGRTFGLVATLLLVFGLSLMGRFGYYYLQNPDLSSHMQSLQVAVGAVILSFIVILMTFMAELMATNRRLCEEIMVRTRRIDQQLAAVQRAADQPVDGVHSTGAQPWITKGA
ncbi:MAG: glycosyltransferase [Nannocystaceae bacterium]